MASYSLESWNLDREQYSCELTKAKDLTLHTLLKHGVINESQAEHYLENFAIIVSKPSLFSKLFGSKDKMIIVEQHSLDEENNE